MTREDSLWNRLQALSRRIAAIAERQAGQALLGMNDPELEAERIAKVKLVDQILDEIEALQSPPTKH